MKAQVFPESQMCPAIDNNTLSSSQSSPEGQQLRGYHLTLQPDRVLVFSPIKWGSRHHWWFRKTSPFNKLSICLLTTLSSYDPVLLNVICFIAIFLNKITSEPHLSPLQGTRLSEVPWPCPMPISKIQAFMLLSRCNWVIISNRGFSLAVHCLWKGILFSASTIPSMLKTPFLVLLLISQQNCVLLFLVMSSFYLGKISSQASQQIFLNSHCISHTMGYLQEKKVRPQLKTREKQN